MMKRNRPFASSSRPPWKGLAAGFAMVVCQAVTGVAQIELSVDSLVFNPTTIDSLSVMEVTVSNALSVDTGHPDGLVSAVFNA